MSGAALAAVEVSAKTSVRAVAVSVVCLNMMMIPLGLFVDLSVVL